MNEITDKEFRAIRDYIKANYGINLSDEKKSLVYSRLRTVLQEKGFASFTQYYDYLTHDKSGEAAIRFIDKITTNHTYFMREADHFEHFRNVALPFAEAAATDKDIRVWCAGCSSGEEAYTLQMLMMDYFRGKPGWNTDILATDISSAMLDKATRGVYEAESALTLPPDWQRGYLCPYGDKQYAVTDTLRGKMTFRRFNLMEEHMPFRRPFHIIFCRNVMIYFNNETRDALVRRFFDVIMPGGFLYIGHSESLNQTDTKFKYIMPAVYRKPL